jgi:hypothetical protein
MWTRITVVPDSDLRMRSHASSSRMNDAYLPIGLTPNVTASRSSWGRERPSRGEEGLESRYQCPPAVDAEGHEDAYGRLYRHRVRAHNLLSRLVRGASRTTRALFQARGAVAQVAIDPLVACLAGRRARRVR